MKALRRFGLIAAALAYAAFVLHVELPEAAHASDAPEHCCICHHASLEPARAPARIIPFVLASRYEPQRPSASDRSAPLPLHQPRAPPVA